MMAAPEPVVLRRYFIPNDNGEGWGLFVIGSDGFFSVCSDYGNYAYVWGKPGMEFRAFLAQLHGDYTSRKLWNGHRQVYDGDRTCAAMKSNIIQLRRTCGQSKEWAREEWDLLESHEWIASEADYIRWGSETTIPDFWDSAHYGVPVELTAFVTRLFPRFQQKLREELAAEATPTPKGHTS